MLYFAPRDATRDSVVERAVCCIVPGMRPFNQEPEFPGGSLTGRDSVWIESQLAHPYSFSMESTMRNLLPLLAIPAMLAGTVAFAQQTPELLQPRRTAEIERQFESVKAQPNWLFSTN